MDHLIHTFSVNFILNRIKLSYFYNFFWAHSILHVFYTCSLLIVSFLSWSINSYTFGLIWSPRNHCVDPLQAILLGYYTVFSKSIVKIFMLRKHSYLLYYVPWFSTSLCHINLFVTVEFIVLYHLPLIIVEYCVVHFNKNKSKKYTNLHPPPVFRSSFFNLWRPLLPWVSSVQVRFL